MDRRNRVWQREEEETPPTLEKINEIIHRDSMEKRTDA